MNPWDEKMTYELNEREMINFARHMEEDGVFERERQVKRMVEEALAQWTANRGQPYWQRNHGPFGAGRVGMAATIGKPERLGTLGDAAYVTVPNYIEFRLMLPEWLDHEQAAFLAEMQIREIFSQYE